MDVARRVQHMGIYLHGIVVPRRLFLAILMSLKLRFRGTKSVSDGSNPVVPVHISEEICHRIEATYFGIISLRYSICLLRSVRSVSAPLPSHVRLSEAAPYVTV